MTVSLFNGRSPHAATSSLCSPLENLSGTAVIVFLSDVARPLPFQLTDSTYSVSHSGSSTDLLVLSFILQRIPSTARSNTSLVNLLMRLTERNFV
ncbi:hypothetical protein EVAR_50399_1 [Eumeta japonica]|uniref:Uncharacterized protein n=1 Tax=Eumeta variegata TaxID=151549 RepID=A0A4C1WY49_EUMVA|nr:hypothetical protein EVAR_50399_1 [Eumeta japonica]